ncbi:hypothetical protein L917_02680, partial [Phytophthora nicotianae]
SVSKVRNYVTKMEVATFLGSLTKVIVEENMDAVYPTLPKGSSRPPTGCLSNWFTSPQTAHTYYNYWTLRRSLHLIAHSTISSALSFVRKEGHMVAL